MRRWAGALAETAPREALRAWWTPRLDRIADWVAEVEAARRADVPPMAIVSEARGAWSLPRPGGPFELIGRADRIERRTAPGPAGHLSLAIPSLAILDYKTGTPPSQTDVEAGLAPQLLLEAAMAEAGAFGAELIAPAAELIYWHLSGGFDPGASLSLFKGNAAAIAAAVTEAAAAPGPADRHVRRPGPALSVAPAPRPRAALRRLRATGARRGVVGGRGGGMTFSACWLDQSAGASYGISVDIAMGIPYRRPCKRSVRSIGTMPRRAAISPSTAFLFPTRRGFFSTLTGPILMQAGRTTTKPGARPSG